METVMMFLVFTIGAILGMEIKATHHAPPPATADPFHEEEAPRPTPTGKTADEPTRHPPT